MNQSLNDRINAIEVLAGAAKWKRLMQSPFRYMSGQWYFRTGYQLTKKGKLVSATTFFDATMQLLLPAGMDIYLLGAKTHDSEIRLTKWMLQNVQPGNTVLDIGVHFGFYSLLASTLVQRKGKVIGVEASKSIYKICLDNVKARTNVELHHLAATDENRNLSFYEFPVLYSEYNTIDPTQFAGQSWIKKNPPKQIEVKGMKGDDLLKRCNAIPDFIKIDVEGAEDKVIAGLTSTLQNNYPVIALEYLSDSRTNKAHQHAAHQLFKLGYSAYTINSTGKLEACDNIVGNLAKRGVESDNIIFVNKNIK